MFKTTVLRVVTKLTLTVINTFYLDNLIEGKSTVDFPTLISQRRLLRPVGTEVSQADSVMLLRIALTWGFSGNAGSLSSVLAVFSLMRLATWAFGGAGLMLFQAELYLGLAVFVGYILFDTQV
jgi:hypothetical protein